MNRVLNDQTGARVRYALAALLIFASVLLTSCTSQIPIATNYEYTEQQKMQAAHHWNVLASDVVAYLKESGKVSKSAPLYVAPKFNIPAQENPVVWKATRPLAPAAESDRFETIPFKRAYQNYLISQLTDAGYNAVDSKRAAELVMTFDIQLIKQPERPVRGPNIISQVGRAIASGLDSAYTGIETSNYEVVITTSVRKGSSYVMCHTGTYYINTPLWDDNYAMQGKVMEVVNQ